MKFFSRDIITVYPKIIKLYGEIIKLCREITIFFSYRKIIVSSQESIVLYREIIVYTEKSAFRTEKSSFRTEKSSFRTEKSSFRTEKSSFRTEKSSFRTEKSSFRTEKWRKHYSKFTEYATRVGPPGSCNPLRRLSSPSIGMQHCASRWNGKWVSILHKVVMDPDLHVVAKRTGMLAVNAKTCKNIDNLRRICLAQVCWIYLVLRDHRFVPRNHRFVREICQKST